MLWRNTHFCFTHSYLADPDYYILSNCLACYAKRQDTAVELAAFTDWRSWVNYGNSGVLDNVVSIVARLQAKLSGIRFWAGAKAFSLIQTCRPAVGLRSLVLKGYWSFFPRRQRGRSVNITTHRHVVLLMARRWRHWVLPKWLYQFVRWR